MTTIDAIKINIRDFRDKLVRRTLTMGMIVKALDNIERSFEEYHDCNYLKIKSLKESIEERDREIERLNEIVFDLKEDEDLELPKKISFKDCIPDFEPTDKVNVEFQVEHKPGIEVEWKKYTPTFSSKKEKDVN